MEGSGSKQSWSELLEDLLVKIAKEVKLIEDYYAFRGVCVSWRAAAAANEKNFTRRIPNIPLLMLAEEEESDDREFFSVCKDKIWRRMPLPEAKGKLLMESKGWFITVDEIGDMTLLHPFTRVQIPLPNQSTIPGAEVDQVLNQYFFLYRAVLSSSPSETNDYVVMVAHRASLGLAFWRPGDQTWTRVEAACTYWGVFADVYYFNGRFYAAKYCGEVWVIDVPKSDDSNRASQASKVTSVGFGRGAFEDERPYLVEVSGKLLAITRDGHERCRSDDDDDEDDDEDDSYGASEFEIFELTQTEEGGGRWTKMESLGKMSVFVGNNSSFSVDARSFSEVIKPNCIYFTDDSMEAYCSTKSGGGRDMGIYHVEDGKIERFGNGGQSFRRSKISPPLWITPYF